MRALGRLLGLVWPLRWPLLGAMTLGAATVGSGVGLMAASAWLIATAALHPSIADLQVAIVGVRFFGVARGTLRYAERLLSHSVTLRLLARIRVWLFRRLEPLVPARTGGLHSGDLLTRIVGDVESLEGFTVRTLGPALVVLPVAVGVGVFLLRYGRELALAAAGTIAGSALALAVAGWLLGGRTGPALSVARSRLATAAVELVQGLADLTAAGRTDEAVASVTEAGGSVTRARFARAVAEAGLDGATILAAGGAVWLAGRIGVSLAGAGAVDGVGLAVILLAVMAAFEAVAALPSAGERLQEQRAAMERILAIVDAEPGVRDPGRPEPLPSRAPEGCPVVRMEGVRFSYPGGARPALDGLDIELGEGERVALVGPSGAGKSTVIALLLRLWDGWEGQIEVMGRDVRRCLQGDVRRRFAVLEQGTHLFNATVRENLALADPTVGEDALWAALELAGLAEEVRAMPDGLDTWIGELGLTLSGGQRRRLAIARTALLDRPVLLLDEPTAGLDRATEAAVLESLNRLSRGRSALTVTHRLVEMERHDRIFVMDRGRIVEQGNHPDLLGMNGVYAALHTAQQLLLQ